MAIGNAPWPIGATMVGIHARPGRERIASKHVARKHQIIFTFLLNEIRYLKHQLEFMI